MGAIKKYWTLPAIARELGISRARVHQIWNEGDSGWKPDAEDHEGRPLFLKCPAMPPHKKMGRPRKDEPPRTTAKPKRS